MILCQQSEDTETCPFSLLRTEFSSITANRLGNSLSGFKLNPDTGALTSNLATPYPTGAYPMAVIAVPHGNHATQSVTP